MKLSFTTVLPISLNSMYQNQAFYNPKTKSYQATGKRILTKEGKQVKARIRGDALIAVRDQKWDINELGDRPLYMDVTVYFNRRGRDSDNLLKSLQDSLQGVVYLNDSQSLARIQRIAYDSKNPRIELSFSEVKFVGIFEDLDILESFESNCLGCSKYRKGSCSILKDSKIGTVREEIGSIYNPVCSEFKLKK